MKSSTIINKGFQPQNQNKLPIESLSLQSDKFQLDYKEHSNSNFSIMSHQNMTQRLNSPDRYSELDKLQNMDIRGIKRTTQYEQTNISSNYQSSRQEDTLRQKQQLQIDDQSMKQSFMKLPRNTVYQKNDLLMFDSINEESNYDDLQNQGSDQNQAVDDEEETDQNNNRFGNKMLTTLKTNRMRGKAVTITQAQNSFRNKVMMITQIRKKMIYFLKNFTLSGRNVLLSNSQARQLINDKSDFEYLRRGILCFNLIIDHLESGFQKADKKVRQFVNLIDPQSGTGFFIQCFFTLFNILFMLMFSIMIVFSGPSWYEALIYRVTNVVWVIEILFALNTQVFDLSTLINDRNVILAFYVRKRALYDLLPFLLVMAIPELETLAARAICQTISFIKLKNIIIDINEIQKRLCMSIKNYYIVELANLIAKLFIIGHFIACIWYLIGRFELLYLKEEKTWYDEGLAEDHVWWKLYLTSFYWALTLMTTGSNTANSLFQMFFTSFIMLFTTIGFGYMLNIIGIILSQLDQQDENKRRDLNVINEYMRTNKISTNLQTRVNLDLEFYYQKNLSKEKEEKQQVLSKISPHLQNLIQIEYCQQIFDKIGSVSNFFSNEVILEMSHEIEEVYYLPHQIIFSESDFRDTSLMFIVQGTVELSCSCIGDEKTLKTIQKLEKDDVFGQISFFTGLSYQMNAKTTTYTKLIKINRDKFINIIQSRERDYEIFCQLRDKLSLYQNYGLIKEKCPFCNCDSHQHDDCHLVHLQKDNIYKKVKFFEKNQQERNSYKRRIAYYNTFKIQKIAEINVKTYKNSLKIEQVAKNIIGDEQFNFQTISENLTEDMYGSSDFEDLTESQYSPIIRQTPKYKSPIHRQTPIHRQSPMHKISPGINNKQRKFNFNEENENNKFDSNNKLDQQSNKQESHHKQDSQIKLEQQLKLELNPKFETYTKFESTRMKCLTPSKVPRIPINDHYDKNSMLQSIDELKPYFNKDESIWLNDNPKYQNDYQEKKRKLQAKWYNKMKDRAKMKVSMEFNDKTTPLRTHYNISSSQIIKDQLTAPTTPQIHERTQQRSNTASKQQLTLEFIQNKLRSLIIEKERQPEIILNPWEFEYVKEYKYYFPLGNSKIVLQRYLKYQRKKYKMFILKKSTK